MGTHGKNSQFIKEHRHLLERARRLSVLIDSARDAMSSAVQNLVPVQEDGDA